MGLQKFTFFKIVYPCAVPLLSTDVTDLQDAAGLQLYEQFKVATSEECNQKQKIVNSLWILKNA